MVKEEIELWKRYLTRYGDTYERYDYDVHVGKGCGKIPGLGGNYQRMAIRLSQKRIDVVAYKGGRANIIEIKPIANMEAIGQLKGYKTLYEDQYGSGTVDKLIIVTTSADQDLRRSASQNLIQLKII